MSHFSLRALGGASLLTLTLFVTFPPHTALAQEEPDVTITRGKLQQSQTVSTVAQARQQINRTAGGVAVVDKAQFENKYAQNFQDTLSYVPGVYAQKRYGEEVRLSIRGSGISRGFHLRGITLLQDGIPFTLADGGSDFQEADPLALQHIEVYKGGNALQYGSNTLGGAINLVSPTGYTAGGDQVRLEAGSENTYRANMRSGRVFGNQDYFVSLTTSDTNGYRQHSDQSNVKLNANYGIKISDTVETRFYLSNNIIEQDLPGTLTRFNALNNRDRASAAALSGDQKRDIRSTRLSNKTSIALNDTTTLEGGLFVNFKQLFHPIFAVVDQKSTDYGVFSTLKGQYMTGEYLNRYRVGVTTQMGQTEALLFTNVRGNRGIKTAEADQKAKNYTAFGENQFFVTPTVALVTAAQLTWASRENIDRFNPSRTDERLYRSFNPKVGVLYEPVAGQQFFANVSKSNEPPTFSELTQTGTTGFIPLSPQQAWTAEIGTRGSSGNVSWDASLYRSWVKNELLQFNTGLGTGIPASTFNANKTLHQGFELGFTVDITETVSWQNAYTYSDFRFQGDRQFGDNDLAGVPPHFYKTSVRYTDPDKWYAAPNLEYVPTGAFVDFANTTDASSYATIGFEAGYELNDRVSVFVDARNLLDKEYISNFSTATTATSSSALYYPADGVSAFAGVVVKF